MGSSSPKAQEALGVLEKRYGKEAVEDADVIVAIGGDGFMLQTLHRTMSSGLPIYGMNRGTIGFLMNQYSEDDLMERVQRAEPSVLHPLRMRAVRDAGTDMDALAINEVSLLRQTRQAAKVRISINDRCACRGVDLRRDHGLHGGRKHRLQPLRPWAHIASQRRRSGADTHQPVSPPAMARCTSFQGSADQTGDS